MPRRDCGLRLACGSHSSTARAAGAASQPSVSATEPPLSCQSGTLTTDATIAPAESAVMYRPMSNPARSGHRRLIRLDSRTFMTAMAPLHRIVPGKSSAPRRGAAREQAGHQGDAGTEQDPLLPRRLARLAAKPETTPKQMTGVAARMEIVAPDRPRLRLQLGEDRRQAGDRAAQVVAEGEHADHEQGSLQPDARRRWRGARRRGLYPGHE